MKVKKNKDSLGSRMKEQYEFRSQTYLPRRTYTILRLDGRAFHTYTRGLQRPFDVDLMKDMDNTAKVLCEQIQGAKMAYVQSDEISIVLTDFDDITTQSWYNSNVQKMVSISASIATAEFNQLRLKRLLEGDDAYYAINRKIIDSSKLAYFDSRVFTIPDPIEVENYLVWRQQDATRNSIQMAAQSMFSHKQLQGLRTSQLQEKMYSEKGINWNHYPEGFKRGRCIVKVYEVSYNMTRSKWIVEAPPIFTQNREYIRSELNLL